MMAFWKVNHCRWAIIWLNEARIHHHCTSVRMYILGYSSSPFSNNWGSSYSHNHCTSIRMYILGYSSSPFSNNWGSSYSHKHCTSVRMYILGYLSSPFSNNWVSSYSHNHCWCGVRVCTPKCRKLSRQLLMMTPAMRTAKI
jgi:hypothetical protein